MRNDFETLLEEFYTALLRRGDTCVDVGAHLGRHALPMARAVGASGEVHLFEPIPACVEALRGMTGRMPAKAVFYPIALSDYQGLSDFVLTENLPEYSGLKERQYDQPVEKRHITVEVHRLDEYGVHMPRLAYVKIDAEGGECGILRGARETLARWRPLVSFEFGMNAAGGYGVVPDDLFVLFEGLGYRIADIRGRPLDRAMFDESARVQHVWDYVAAPADRFDTACRTLAANAARG